MVQILYNGVDVIFDFSSYIAEEIHNGLNGIEKGKIEKPSGWYSMLMHIFPFKGAFNFEKEIKLIRE